MWFALWALGCGGDREPVSPHCSPLELEPTWFATPRVQGLRFFEVSFDEPVELRVVHDDGQREVSHVVPEALEHAWAWVGLADGPHTLRLEASSPGCGVVSTEHKFQVEHVPGLVSEVLELDADAMGPDWTAVPLSLWDEKILPLVMLDASGTVVWSATSDRPVRELRWTDQGTIRGTGAGALVELDLAGSVLSVVEPEAGPLHHDVVPLADGTFWTLVDQTIEVDEYPLGPDDLDTYGPATLRDQIVVRMDAEGRTLAQRALSDVLDTRRVGHDSHDRSAEGLEWAHANGLADDGAGGVWVSVRHQDAVIHLDADLRLTEILGDPAGWREPWSDHLLELTEGSWPYHVHAPEVLPDGTLAMFDNHNNGATIYAPPVEGPLVSRAVAYRIADGTAAQVWEHHDTATGSLYSGAVGDVDVDGEGRVLADFGFVRFEDGASLTEQGLGDMAARLVVWDAGGVRRMDVRLAMDGVTGPQGLFAYRAERVPALGGLRELERPDDAVMVGP